MAVHDDCKLKFLKAKRIHCFVVFKIEEKASNPALSSGDFTASLPADECRYAVYDFNFVTEENCQKRSPDASRVGSKMIYESSKDRFRRELDGILVEERGTDPTEMDLPCFQKPC